MSDVSKWDNEPGDGMYVGTIAEFLNYSEIVKPGSWRAFIPLIPDDDQGYGPEGKFTREQWEAFPGEHYHFAGCGCKRREEGRDD